MLRPRASALHDGAQVTGPLSRDEALELQLWPLIAEGIRFWPPPKALGLGQAQASVPRPGVMTWCNEVFRTPALVDRQLNSTVCSFAAVEHWAIQ